MFRAIKERIFAKRLIRRLLKSYSAVSGANVALSGSELYRDVLLHSRMVKESEVDDVLRRSEESVDDWTAGAEDSCDFRQVVHFIVMTKYDEAGNVGSVISFKDIVYLLVPARL